MHSDAEPAAIEWALQQLQQLLDALWKTVDDEIASGKLPRFEQLQGGTW